MKFGLFEWSGSGWKFLREIDRKFVHMNVRLADFEWLDKGEWLHCVKLLGV